MDEIDELLLQSFRNEWRADLRTLRTTTRQQINSVRRDVAGLAEQIGAHHTETTRGLAHAGDQLAAIEKTLQPLIAAGARRARRRALARRAVTSVPGVIGAVSALAAAAAAAIGLL